MEKYSEVFYDSYRRAVETAYEDYLKIEEVDFPVENAEREKKLHIYLQDAYRKWLCAPLEQLGGKTPVEYIETISSLKTLAEMFTYGVAACDDGLPEIFLDKLKSYGENAIDVLLEIAAQNSAGNGEEAILASLMAVKVLGEWKVQRAVEPVIKLLNFEGEYCELMHETVRDALIGIDTPALDSIFSALDSGVYSQSAVEYLLMALTDIGRKNRNDKIYSYLKKSFLKASEKLVAASCLGNYGDGRAIPSLRGFLEKNTPTLDKETFCEIVTAIKHLGGRIDDLKFTNYI